VVMRQHTFIRFACCIVWRVMSTRHVCRQLSSRSIGSCSKAVYKYVWHTPLLSVQWINCWWWTEEPSETCRISWKKKFVKFGFITKSVMLILDSLRAGSGWSCSKAVYKPVWHIPLLSVQWINSWWWTDELSETCRVSWQNKFAKLVHFLVLLQRVLC
jgi:hypothetical protein